MMQEEKLLWLIKFLINENKEYSNLKIPHKKEEQKILFRSLMNIRPPMAVTEEFLKIQDSYLSQELKNKKITSLEELNPIENNIYLWKGDITTLKADAIVNAANSALLGCFVPCHKCIDNAIHSASGVQLRLSCNDIMENQGHEELTGDAKITRAFNLPCKYVLHTVEPIIQNSLTELDCKKLASCYNSCLSLAKEHNLKSIAFCCISTGEFHFPNEKAAEIAVNAVRNFTEITKEIKVIFNVFKEEDYEIYKHLLGRN